MLESLRKRLMLASNFPSPPAIAQQMIELAGDPDADAARAAAILSKDPSLAAKILRIANSPLYAKQHRADNLRQSVVVLGLNAALTLALSFSLIGTFKTQKASRLDYTRYWRRTLLSAYAARAFAELERCEAPDDVFLAALLQDIAVLAIDRVQPGFYEDLAAHATHPQWVSHEVTRLGVDHAAVSAWLMRFWKLPETLCQSVEWSHSPTSIDPDTRLGCDVRCVALGSECAEVLLGDRNSQKLMDLAASAEAWLGIENESMVAALETIVGHIPEIERLFDASLLDPEICAAILEQSREMLVIRNLQSVQQLGALQRLTEQFAVRTAELEDRHRRDTLTGVFNRGHLDRVLEAEFCGATAGGWPLSVVFADLDRFKDVNDTYGHPAGDAVLVATANLILDVVRDTDCVARYGGEEFIIILPGLGTDGALAIAQTILARLRAAEHSVAGGKIIATASLGLATHHSEAPFRSATHLLEAADRAVYAAKRLGRNRLVVYDSTLEGTRSSPSAECRV